MSDNTIKTADGAEIYLNSIWYYADRYIEEELGGDTDKLNKRFRDMILYISDQIEKPDNDDIVLLDKIFDIYIRLCTKYEKLPTLECFSWLVGIDRNTFTDWKEQRYRVSTAHGSTIKKWLEICKGFCLDELSNAKFANPNLIFTAKAAYGLRETAPIPAVETPLLRPKSIEELPTKEQVLAMREQNQI